jgi:hypothetical protein
MYSIFRNRSWKVWSNFRKNYFVFRDLLWVSVLLTSECTEVMEVNVASSLKLMFRFSCIHMWVWVNMKVRNDHPGKGWNFQKKKKNYNWSTKVQNTKNFISIYCCIQMRYILNCNEQTPSRVPHIFVNKRVSIRLQRINLQPLLV